MIAARTGLPVVIAAVFGLAGCFTAPHPSAITTPPEVAPSPPPAAPPATGDVIPRAEPRSRYGNPPFYEVFGKRYYVLASGAHYIERGVASWYGPGFHKERTSAGEPYDMYSMTAAHKTLPLPAYVRVTNLQNGRSVVVRVNDRGPFVGNRIIDLSYTAASRLDMLRSGTAMVEVRALDAVIQPATVRPVATPMAAIPATAPSLAAPMVSAPIPLAPSTVQQVPVTALFVQAGAFSDPANADRLIAKLNGGSYGKVFLKDDVIEGRRMYRVRIGPVPTVPEFDRIVAALEHAGVHDAHLALD